MSSNFDILLGLDQSVLSGAVAKLYKKYHDKYFKGSDTVSIFAFSYDIMQAPTIILQRPTPDVWCKTIPTKKPPTSPTNCIQVHCPQVKIDLKTISATLPVDVYLSADIIAGVLKVTPIAATIDISKLPTTDGQSINVIAAVLLIIGHNVIKGIKLPSISPFGKVSFTDFKLSILSNQLLLAAKIPSNSKSTSIEGFQVPADKTFYTQLSKALMEKLVDTKLRTYEGLHKPVTIKKDGSAALQIWAKADYQVGLKDIKGTFNMNDDSPEIALTVPFSIKVTGSLGGFGASVACGLTGALFAL
jgi:hypothetical protein